MCCVIDRRVVFICYNISGRKTPKARDQHLRLTQPYFQWVLVALFSDSEADNSPPSSAKVKNKWSYTFTLYQTYFSLGGGGSVQLTAGSRGVRISGQ